MRPLYFPPGKGFDDQKKCTGAWLWPFGSVISGGKTRQKMVFQNQCIKPSGECHPMIFIPAWTTRRHGLQGRWQVQQRYVLHHLYLLGCYDIYIVCLFCCIIHARKSCWIRSRSPHHPIIPSSPPHSSRLSSRPKLSPFWDATTNRQPPQGAPRCRGAVKLCSGDKLKWQHNAKFGLVWGSHQISFNRVPSIFQIQSK